MAARKVEAAIHEKKNYHRHTHAGCAVVAAWPAPKERRERVYDDTVIDGVIIMAVNRTRMACLQGSRRLWVLRQTVLSIFPKHRSTPLAIHIQYIVFKLQSNISV